jgi:hemolysin type calcium-binding protein
MRARLSRRPGSPGAWAAAGALAFAVLMLVVLAVPAIADTKRGTRGNDVLRAGDDGSRLIGGFGNDRLIGGDDDDLLYGGPGRDRLSGGDDDDGLYGGAGNDRLSGGDDNDRLYGNAGNDVILARDGERDVVRCGPGRDQAVVDQKDSVSGCEVVLRARTPGDDDGRDDDD